MRRTVLLLLTAASLGGIAALPAEAASRRARYANDIVITKRSYFDAGVVVKPGSLGALNYVNASQNATPPYANINSQFGGETLPLPGSLPGCCGVPFSRFSN